MGTEGVDTTSRESLPLRWILRPWTSEEDQMPNPEFPSAQGFQNSYTTLGKASLSPLHNPKELSLTLLPTGAFGTQFNMT